MSSYTRITGLLLLAVTACSDPIVTPAMDLVPDLSPDLELALPNLRQLATVHHDTVPTPTIPTVAEASNYAGGGGDDIDYAPQEYRDAAMRAVITRLNVDVGFMDDVNVAYAQSIGESLGSYYRNHILLKVRYGNTEVGRNEATEEEECLCAHLFSPWGRTASTTVNVSDRCGHDASATASLAARLDFTTPWLKKVNLRSDQTSSSGVAFQPACPTNNGNVNGSGGTEGEEWYLCFWEDYYYGGEFLRRQELGCMPLNDT